MNEYEFTLKFRLPERDGDPEQFVDALAEAGCTDALVGIGQVGRIGLDFTRESTNALTAIASAIQDVRRAIPDAQLVEVTPDLVGMSDVASIAGFSRQNMRKLVESNLATFPVAVHEGTLALWHLSDTLAWLQDHRKLELDLAMVEVAQAAKTINIAKEARQLPGVALPKDLAPLFA